MWVDSKFGVLLIATLSIFVSSMTAFADGDPLPGGGGGGDFIPPEPVIDWQSQIDATGRLGTLDFGLLGESIDPHMGGISFAHTDVSLPGNSSLPVSIQRRIKPGGLYHPSIKAEFGDWELIVPRIKVLTSSLSNYRTGNRCSDSDQLQSVLVPYPAPAPGNPNSTITQNRRTYSAEYSNGYSMDIPGYGTQTMLKHTAGSPAIYPSGTDFVTASGWKIDCISGIEGGGEGYEATSPDGTVYTFNKFYEIRATNLGFLGHTDVAFERYVSIVAAKLVTDVHGNTVEYTYDASNRLIRIEGDKGGSDVRVITLSYDDVNGTDMISRVTANPGTNDERHWDYSYDTNDLYSPYYTTANVPIGAYPTLTTVEQPDGESWVFELEAMSAETPPALSCFGGSFSMSVTHPYGTKGDYAIMAL